jgi:pimeloyl-ACP methyl ester carboxylesterase
MRARYPDTEGFVERDGVKVAYEVFGSGEPALVFAPTDPLVHSRAWKAQVPYLARTSRVVTIDPRGNGRSDRPESSAAYADTEFAADTIAVMDATGVDRAILVGICSSAWTSLLAAALHPDRVLGVVSIATWAPFLTPPSAVRAVYDFDEANDTDEGWAKENRHYWLRDWRGYAEFFFGELLPEPHSTKLHEDLVSWAMDTSAETNLLFVDAPFSSSSCEDTEAILARVSCPVLAIHGREDCCQPCERSEQAAALTGSDLLMLDGAGHVPTGREPVVVNRAIRDFADRFRPAPQPAPVRRTWTRPLNRPKRVLYVSSPIGLGHARRDLAIADELRKLKPGLEVHWLAQHPVTELLRRRSELIHPASAFLASESGHIESEAAEHDLHAFQAVRSMDEILVANFMVFAELTENEPFDLWVGDEAWDIDYFLHENPELKRAPYAWMTDFVGWLPMPDGGPREQALTADYNAEMIEQIARFPALRDRSEGALELRPLQQEQIPPATQQWGQLGEHLSQGPGIAEAEAGGLQPVEAVRQGLLVGARAPGRHRPQAVAKRGVELEPVGRDDAEAGEEVRLAGPVPERFRDPQPALQVGGEVAGRLAPGDGDIPAELAQDEHLQPAVASRAGALGAPGQVIECGGVRAGGFVRAAAQD